jgi:NADH-quinone oxidoreductase subunit C
VNLEEQTQYIKDNFSGKVTIPQIENDNLIIYVEKDDIISFLDFAKKDKELSFKLLLDVFGIDTLTTKKNRFEVVYNLLSLKLNNRITVKVALDENVPLETATTIFRSANWYEREVFDMYGITFLNHPDLRRILSDYGFEGHPLRKDFPLTGYKELSYDNEQQKIVSKDVELMQEYRNFDFDSPWDGTEYNLPGDEKAENIKN